MEQSDEHLFIAYRNGDEHALDLLVGRITKLIYNFVVHFSGKTDEANDIVQEVFVKIWKYRNRYQEGKSFKIWLLTIARNTTIDWLRKKKSLSFVDFEREESDSFSETIPDVLPLPEKILQKSEDIAFVASVLQLLPQEQREVLVLRYKEELSFEEIAVILNKPMNTVKSKHQRAITALRTILRGKEELFS